MSPAPSPDLLATGGYPRRRSRAMVWLVFVALPLADAVRSDRGGIDKAAIIAAAAVFVGVFVWLVLVEKPLPARRALSTMIPLLAIAAGLTIADRQAWAMLFIYCAGAASVVFHARFAIAGVAATTAVGALALALHGSSSGAIVSYGASAGGVGMLMVAVAELRESNRQLVAARAELAKTAVAKERERFARDLHDLLGHSLSVIALKAELAGRLLPGRAAEAAAEVAELEQVARDALGEVREAVSGYRRPTLDGELAGARMVLSAAGIAAEVDRGPVVVDPDVEAVLAWAIREGATNVIRHSGARRCTLRVSASLGGAAAEVVDDGTGANGQGPGNGLSGLRERARAVGGELVAGNLPSGGYRLALTVPRGGA